MSMRDRFDNANTLREGVEGLHEKTNCLEHELRKLSEAMMLGRRAEPDDLLIWANWLAEIGDQCRQMTDIIQRIQEKINGMATEVVYAPPDYAEVKGESDQTGQIR